MKLSGDSISGIDNGNQNTVCLLSSVATPLRRCWRRLRNTSLPKIRFGSQHHASVRRRMLQSIIEQICHALLDLLIIKFEQWQFGVDFYIQPDLGPLKSILPAAGQVTYAIC